MSEVVFSVFMPMYGAILLAILGRNANLRDGITMLTALATFAVVSSLVPEVMAGGRPESHLWTVMPGVELAFRAAKLRDLATRAELSALRSQVLPHFLFNTLHSLGAAVPRELEGLRSRIGLGCRLLRGDRSDRCSAGIASVCRS